MKNISRYTDEVFNMSFTLSFSVMVTSLGTSPKLLYTRPG